MVCPPRRFCESRGNEWTRKILCSGTIFAAISPCSRPDVAWKESNQKIRGCAKGSFAHMSSYSARICARAQCMHAFVDREEGSQCHSSHLPRPAMRARTACLSRCPAKKERVSLCLSTKNVEPAELSFSDTSSLSVGAWQRQQHPY